MGIEEVNDQFRWTLHHFDLLDKVVTAYIDSKNMQFAPTSYDESTAMAWGRFEATEGSLAAVSHIFGDVLQNANSTLDYLVCELFSAHNSGEPAERSHKFPLVSSHKAFNKEIGNGALSGIPFGAVAAIESLQPFKGKTDRVRVGLKNLRALTNHHKHRKIHVSVLAANPAPEGHGVLMKNDGVCYAAFKDLPKAMHSTEKIGPFPVTEKQEVDVDWKFTPVVVLEQDGFRDRLITLVAEELCQAVAESCKRLEPFFS